MAATKTREGHARVHGGGPAVRLPLRPQISIFRATTAGIERSRLQPTHTACFMRITFIRFTLPSCIKYGRFGLGWSLRREMIALDESSEAAVHQDPPPPNWHSPQKICCPFYDAPPRADSCGLGMATRTEWSRSAWCRYWTTERRHVSKSLPSRERHRRRESKLVLLSYCIRLHLALAPVLDTSPYGAFAWDLVSSM